jgi:capsular polysaccharide biosynthesis protein
MENRNIEEEISLKELIMTLIKNWKIIVICTVMALVLAFIYLFGIAKPVYESSVSGIISIPETVESKYGIYTFPSINKMDYINIVTSHEVLSKTKKILSLESSIESLRSRISIISEKDMNGFTITVSSDTPENAQVLAKTLSNVLIEELECRYKENAIEAFLRDLDVSGKQLTENIKKSQLELEGLENELAKVDSVITLKKMLTSNPTLAAEIANQRGVDIADLSNEVMYEEYINPNYTELEALVIQTRTALNSSIISLENNSLLVKELSEEALGMQLYKTTGDSSKINVSTLDILRSKISINETPSFSENAVSPRKTLTFVLDLILGLMGGVFAAVFKNYWKTA